MKFRVEDADAYEARVKSFLDAVFGVPSVECDAFFGATRSVFPTRARCSVFVVAVPFWR